LLLNRTEEAVGSSPTRSTINTSRLLFCFAGDYVESMWFLLLSIFSKTLTNDFQSKRSKAPPVH